MSIEIRSGSLQARIQKQLEATGSASTVKEGEQVTSDDGCEVAVKENPRDVH